MAAILGQMIVDHAGESHFVLAVREAWAGHELMERATRKLRGR
jgi:hypothetical protein